MAAKTADVRQTLEAIVILLAFGALLVLVPHNLLAPLAVCVTVLATLIVVGARLYLQRLRRLASLLTKLRDVPDARGLGAFLPPHERRLLWLRETDSVAEVVRTLQRRESLFTSLGVGVGFVGICAFLVVVVLVLPGD